MRRDAPERTRQPRAPQQREFGDRTGERRLDTNLLAQLIARIVLAGQADIAELATSLRVGVDEVRAAVASVTASQATINYVGEEGRLCKPSTGLNNSTTLTGHVKDPITGVSYFTEIQNAIKAAGFVPETLGTIGGGDSKKDYCRLFTT